MVWVEVFKYFFINFLLASIQLRILTNYLINLLIHKNTTMSEEKEQKQDNNEKESEYVGTVWSPNFLRWSAIVILFFLALFIYRHCTYGDLGGGVDGIRPVL